MPSAIRPPKKLYTTIPPTKPNSTILSVTKRNFQ